MADRPATPEARKVVTVLFADITGSTGLGERLDPEPLRHVLSRYFSEMEQVVERHGGLVLKFIGDAVMAAFGVPAAHEDDALRAVRAAAEMRERLGELNVEFEATWGVTVAVRTGVNTGEVLLAEPGGAASLVVGDGINVAARLEQAAAPGEVLVGEDTHRLVREAVTAEPIGELELRGRAAPVGAWRLLDVAPHAPGVRRRLDSPLVGRARELALLDDAFARVAETGTCEVVTVMGPAGAGKSRLTAEFVARLGARATVLQGRCLPYGDGITFWPVAGLVMDAIGMEERDSPAEARAKLEAVLARTAGDVGEDDLVVDGLAPMLGLPAADAGVQETYWAVRRFLERLAARGPVVAVLDDVHWGEPTFLDLVGYLADWTQAAPVLLVCQARPELLDARPGWLAGKANTSAIVLPGLTEDDTDGLIRGLVGGSELPAAARARIAQLAEGNPLFVEETVRMLVDDGVLHRADGRWEVAGDLAELAIPPTIVALLSARLDRLEPEQRTVIERASVVGRTFWWGAVSDLAPAELRPRVGAVLQALVAKQLVCPDRSEIRGQDAFRFTHILVRDAAYAGVPKATRAALHEQLAAWIEATTRDVAGEYEEIVGYHLEQAHDALRALGPRGERTADLGRRAAARLGAAGRRAFARGDMPAAVTLLSRAAALLPTHDGERLELLADVAFALLETADFDRLVAVAEELREGTAAAGDPALQAHATLIGLWVRLFTTPEGWAAEAEREAQRAIGTLTAVGDERGLARAWSLLGLVGMLGSRMAAAEAAWTRAVEHADRAGTRREAVEGLAWVAVTAWVGPTDAAEGVRRCEQLRERAHGDRKAMSTALFAQAGLEADLGRFDAARELFARSRALLEEVALPVWLAGAFPQALGWALLLEGRAGEAERELRRAYEALRDIGEVTFLSTVAGILAEALHAQGRDGEALRFTEVCEESAGEGDVYSQLLWRSVRAKCLARCGDLAPALALAEQCAGLVEATDALDLRRHVHLARAEVLRLAGHHDDARDACRLALATAEAKGNVVGARHAREALDALSPPAAAAPPRRAP